MANERHELPEILMIVPGGLEHGGGIGRAAGYVLQAWEEQELPEISLCDSRGPGHVAASPFYLVRCLSVVLARAFRRPILHVHVAGRGSTVRKCVIVHFAALVRARLVLHLHDYNYRSFCASLPYAMFALVRSMFRRSHQIIVLSKADELLVLEKFHVEPERVNVVGNAVPDLLKKGRLIERAAGPARILFLGELSHRKGVHDLIAALSAKCVLECDWRATLAGGGPHLDEFRSRAELHGIGKRVEFTGWLDLATVRRLLERADMLVLPSYAEGMPMSVLEAMSYGICVICTPVGALAEVIENDVSGILVEPGDQEALAKAIHRCVTDIDTRARLGAGARRRFRERHDVAAYPERLHSIYEAAVRSS